MSPQTSSSPNAAVGKLRIDAVPHAVPELFVDSTTQSLSNTSVYAMTKRLRAAFQDTRGGIPDAAGVGPPSLIVPEVRPPPLVWSQLYQTSMNGCADSAFTATTLGDPKATSTACRVSAANETDAVRCHWDPFQAMSCRVIFPPALVLRTQSGALTPFLQATLGGVVEVRLARVESMLSVETEIAPVFERDPFAQSTEVARIAPKDPMALISSEEGVIRLDPIGPPVQPGGGAGPS